MKRKAYVAPKKPLAKPAKKIYVKPPTKKY